MAIATDPYGYLRTDPIEFDAYREVSRQEAFDREGACHILIRQDVQWSDSTGRRGDVTGWMLIKRVAPEHDLEEVDLAATRSDRTFHSRDFDPTHWPERDIDEDIHTDQVEYTFYIREDFVISRDEDIDPGGLLS